MICYINHNLANFAWRSDGGGGGTKFSNRNTILDTKKTGGGRKEMKMYASGLWNFQITKLTETQLNVRERALEFVMFSK